ncbi:hypothetical protein BDB00DRAFT_401655 [Zychaea mexicana]|uniref:uncharacterized protein n=1 Tax=Zychaea mexicana TaxID=64656 RepID=UPI0022FE3D17|nr:uncharacterized protein BDB00DRAFT_401655 [Zychaea mexicana]KAI9498750.1 hypothetical protein BDB00DRAFT_401655 [Zychaea mexicana]
MWLARGQLILSCPISFTSPIANPTSRSLLSFMTLDHLMGHQRPLLLSCQLLYLSCNIYFSLFLSVSTPHPHLSLSPSISYMYYHHYHHHYHHRFHRFIFSFCRDEPKPTSEHDISYCSPY